MNFKNRNRPKAKTVLVYITVFGVAVGLATLAELNHKGRQSTFLPRKATITALMVGITLVAVSALRWRVGTDYWTYDRAFPRYAAEAEEGLSIVGEPGIRIISWIAMQTSGDSAAMFAIAAAITIGLTIRTIWRWSPVFAFSVAIYILSGAWHGSFNGVRQYLAGAILFSGHRYIIERKFFKWVAVVFIASLFHVSAVVGVLFYLLPTQRTSFGIQITLIILGVVGMFGMGSLIDFVEAATGDTDRWGGHYANLAISPIRVAFAFLPIALFWILRARKLLNRDQGWFYINMLAFYSATYMASLTSAMVARFAIYPLPFIAIGLAYATSIDNAKERTLLRAFVLGLYGLFMWFEISATTSLSHFQWIFERE